MEQKPELTLEMPAPTLTLDAQPATPADQKAAEEKVEPVVLDEESPLRGRAPSGGGVFPEDRPFQFHAGAAVRRRQPEESGGFFPKRPSTASAPRTWAKWAT